MGPKGRLKFSVRRFFSRKFFKRDHQKLVLVDDHVFIGSSNIGADYGGPRYGNDSFLDLNLRLQGYCVEKLYHLIEELLFGKKSHLETFSPSGWKKRRLLREFAQVKSFRDADYVRPRSHDLLASKFGKSSAIQNDLFDNIARAQRKIVLLAPYFFDSVLDFLPLVEALERGVEVEILTAQRRDINCYKSLHNRFLFKRLIDAGAKVFEYPDKFLHAKAFLFDDRVLHVGSFNLDGWSFKNNTGALTRAQLPRRRRPPHHHQVASPGSSISTSRSANRRCPWSPRPS